MTDQPSSNAELRELLDRRAIDDVLYRYAHALDFRDWELLKTVFTADAVADFLDLGGVNEGIEAITTLIAGVLTGLDASQHLIATPRVQVDGDTATSTCYLQAQHVYKGAEGGDNFLVGGHYVDRLVLTPDGWRIAHRTLHASWTDGNPGVFPAAAERFKATSSSS